MGPLNREQIAADPNVRGINGLNLTHVQLTPEGNSVAHLEAKTLTGKRVTIRARKYALCCHGIENARLLLASNDVQSAGIGNDRDHVGRYFMEHPHLFASRFVPSRAFPALYDRHYASLKRMNANLSFSDDFTREAQLLQYYCRFNPVYVSEGTDEAKRHLRADAMDPGDLEFLRDMATVIGDIGGVAQERMLRAGIWPGRPLYYALEHRLEQAPNPSSRVVLSERRDALGNRIADLDWRLNDIDIDSFRRGQTLMSQEVAALGWGRIVEEEITRDLVEARVEGHYHHIGTTRMSANPADGVVDPDCRVHGVDNLYVAGSSIFPTAGYSGPTMMIMAFALRLAEHMRGELA